MLVSSIFSFSHNVFKMLLFQGVWERVNQLKSDCVIANNLTLSQTTILDSSKLKVFADDNFEFDENAREISKRVENPVGKGEIALFEQFLLFTQCFEKTFTADA